MTKTEKRLFIFRSSIVNQDAFDNVVVTNSEHMVKARNSKIAKSIIFKTFSTQQVSDLLSLELVNRTDKKSA